MKGNAIDQSIGGFRGSVEVMTGVISHSLKLSIVSANMAHTRVTIDNFGAKVRKI